MPVRAPLILAMAACFCAPALPQQRFQMELLCDGPVLKGLRGVVPKAGPVTIYIPPQPCDNAPTRPLTSTT